MSVVTEFTTNPPINVAGPWPVRTVLDLPEGGFEYQRSGPCPFTIVRWDGELPTWWRPATWWPDGSVRKAEVGAQDPDAATMPGRMRVIQQDSLIDNELPDLPKPLTALLVPWGSIALVIRDVKGLAYAADCTLSVRGDGYPDAGHVHTASKLHALYSLRTVARPLGDSPDHLPHAGGVRAQLTVHAGLEVAELVLTWHNAVADERHAPESTLGDLRFLDANLLLPFGWRAVSVTPMPGALEPSDSLQAERTSVSLIPPITEDGEPRAHVLKQQRLKTWRLVLFRDGDESAARAIAARCGRGVAYSGFCASNPLSAAWAVGLPAPERRDSLALAASWQIRDDLTRLQAALATGSKFDHRHEGPLGPFRTWRSRYGGETGGEETGALAGVEAVIAASSEGLVWHATLAEMMLDRSGGWLFNIDGEPNPCDIAVDGGRGANYELAATGPGEKLSPHWKSGKDPLGFLNPLPENTRPGEIPDASYVAELSRFGTHDHQHLRRTTFHLEAMLVLEADPTAAWLLEGVAATVIASWNDRGTVPFGSTLGWLHQQSQDVRKGLGSPRGRDLAHNLYTMALAATLHPPGGDWPAQRRDRYVEWMRMALETLIDLQGAHGIHYAVTSGKPAQLLGNRADATQFYEHAMTMGSVSAATYSWLGGLNPKPRQVPWRGQLQTSQQPLHELRDFLLDAARALVAWWRPGDVSPFYHAGTQPLGNTNPEAVWHSPFDQPEPIVSSFASDSYPPLGMAVALAELTIRLGDDDGLEEELLKCARLFARGNEPLKWLHQQLLRNLTTWGGLTAVLEARSALETAASALANPES